MKTPHLYFHACLAALLMLTAVPAKAADVKELFAIDLPDYPGKEGRMIEVSYPPGATCFQRRQRPVSGTMSRSPSLRSTGPTMAISAPNSPRRN